MSFRSLILKAAGIPVVRRTVSKGRVFKGLVRRFIAGETAEEAVAAASVLVGEGFKVTLDLLGENVSTVEEAAKSRAEYIALIHAIGERAKDDAINISIKLTALGLDQGVEVAEENFVALLQAAEPYGMFVRADMESSHYTETTIAMIERLRGRYPNTGTVLQSYLRRTDSDIERLMLSGCRLRLVKGAYLEPSSVAYPGKEQVDEAYEVQARKLLTRARYPALATHDEFIINRLVHFVREHGVSVCGFEWQMLYGIRRDLQTRLKDEGYNVRVYVPFGSAWYPYFSRRLAERPANLLFILRAMFKG